MLFGAIIGGLLGVSVSGGFKDIGETKQDIIHKRYLNIAKENGINVDEIENALQNDTFKSQEEYLKEKNAQLKELLNNINPLRRQTNQYIEDWLASDNECTDGEDDGQISFWSKVGNCLEGAAKTVVGTIHNIVSDPAKFAATAAGAVVAMLAATTPVGAVIVAATGIIGACKLLQAGIKNIVEAEEKTRNATTDAEAKDAWEKIGQGGTQVVAGAAVMYSSGSSLINTVTSTPQAFAAENARIFESDSSFLDAVAEEVATSIFDPGNIEAA